MKKSELLAPAGNFQTAIAALNAGANAIYCGLQKFSARKSATNISNDELLRLQTLAKEKSANIYVTLNTIIKESELEDLIQTLRFLDFINIDAVIIQDLGVLQIIKQYFPKLVVHASTQMAIHNESGLKMAYKLGIKRAVLARELSFDEIKHLRQACPEIELEYFIHGALCYSVSGMCLASGLLLNRSGNRGECAQICRSYYQIKEQNNNSKFCFSCNDLALFEHIRKLEEIGIDSLKIEGRMKESNYVTATIATYRKILDQQNKESINESMIASKVSFARKQTDSYFTGIRNNLVNQLYAGHMGHLLGTIIKQVGNKITLKLNDSLIQNDTIMIFSNNVPCRFQAFDFFNSSGRKIITAKQGDEVTITLRDLDKNIDTKEVFLIQRGKLSSDKVDYKTIKPQKVCIPIECRITNGQITFLYEQATKVFDVTFQESDKDMLFTAFNTQLEKSQDLSYYFKLNDCYANEFSKKFLPNSIIKEIKNQIYQVFKPLEKPMNIPFRVDTNLPAIGKDNLQYITERANLSPKTKLPFIGHDDLEIGNLSKYRNGYVVPLNPLNFDSNFENKLLVLVTQYPNEQFLIGINNLGHFHLFETFSKYANVSFFIDAFIYCANSYCRMFLEQQSQKLQFIYNWIESTETVIGTVSMKDTKTLPLFISRACFHKHNQIQKCSNCSKNLESRISNGKNNFQIITRDCISYTFKL